MANPRKKRSWKWVFYLLVPLLGGVAFFSVKAIGRSSPKIDAEKLAKVERIDLARSVVATGKIEPVTKVEIKSKASGIIQQLPVNVGDVVRKGQVICKLDENDLLPRVRQSQAALSLAEAALKSAQADYERNKVDADGPDVPFLKRDMERARRMYGEKLIARRRADEAEKKYEMALQPAAVGGGEPGRGRRRRSPRRRPPSNRRGRRCRSRKRICATPRSSRRSTAWCSRAIAKRATRSAPF